MHDRAEYHLGRGRHVNLCLEPAGYARSSINEGHCPCGVEPEPMDMSTAAVFLLAVMCTHSAWLTSIVFCSAHDERHLLIAAASFIPIGVVHGIGVWFGGC
jgi:hypothetical protein